MRSMYLWMIGLECIHTYIYIRMREQVCSCVALLCVEQFFPNSYYVCSMLIQQSHRLAIPLQNTDKRKDIAVYIIYSSTQCKLG